MHVDKEIVEKNWKAVFLLPPLLLFVSSVVHYLATHNLIKTSQSWDWLVIFYLFIFAGAHCNIWTGQCVPLHLKSCGVTSILQWPRPHSD